MFLHEVATAKPAGRRRPRLATNASALAVSCHQVGFTQHKLQTGLFYDDAVGISPLLYANQQLAGCDPAVAVCLHQSPSALGVRLHVDSSTQHQSSGMSFHDDCLETMLHEVATPEPLQGGDASEWQVVFLLWLSAATRSAPQRTSCISRCSVTIP